MRRPKPPSIVTLAVMTTITIVFWIFFSVYQILTTDADVDIPPEILIPLDPTLNRDALNEIESKLYFEEGQVTPFVASPDQTQQEILITTGSPTPTVSLDEQENENTATDSAQAEQVQSDQ